MLSVSQQPLLSLGLPVRASEALRGHSSSRRERRGGRRRCRRERGWAGVGSHWGTEGICSATPKQSPDPFDLRGQTFLLFPPFVYWEGCVWCSVPFSSVHGTARGSRCSRNLFWRKTCFEHQEKMRKQAVLVIIRKQNLLLVFAMRAA